MNHPQSSRHTLAYQPAFARLTTALEQSQHQTQEHDYSTRIQQLGRMLFPDIWEAPPPTSEPPLANERVHDLRPARTNDPFSH